MFAFIDVFDYPNFHVSEKDGTVEGRTIPLGRRRVTHSERARPVQADCSRLQVQPFLDVFGGALKAVTAKKDTGEPASEVPSG